MSLSLASLFQDHAVIQRGVSVPVWGWADPFVHVRVSLGGHTAECIANERGEFYLQLQELAQEGSHSLVVEIVESAERLEIHHLVAGEVWLASGQSNMEWPLGKSLPLTEKDIASAQFPQIRFFSVSPRAHLGPHRTVHGTWKIASPENAGPFSAVAYSFARKLHQTLGVPIGIISSSWGGSIIQSWLSRSALAFNLHTRDWLSKYESEAWTSQRWMHMGKPGLDGRVCALPADPGNTGMENGWHLPPFQDSNWETIDLPATWQSAGHKHSGIYWFRRTLHIPAEWIGKELVLRLGAIDKQDITYVNGVEIGRTGKDFEDNLWDQPRIYQIPGKLVARATLTIAVRVYSFVYNGGLTGPCEAMVLHPQGNPNQAKTIAGTWRYHCEHNFGYISEFHLTGHGERNSPHMLYDNMVHPLAPFPLRGVLWYQGESNLENGDSYASLLKDLVQDWRRLWGDPSLAFHLVQLPGFQSAKAHQSESQWARIREAQCEILSVPHTGVCITIDLGEAGDIHPKNKIPVGERLAQSVLVGEYHQAGEPCGPIFEKITIDGNDIRCIFRHTGPCLATFDGEPPRPFYIAGEDRIFHPAEARIQGCEILVHSPAVPHPVAVRYAWADNPEGCNVIGGSGLMASPFRSDKW